MFVAKRWRRSKRRTKNGQSGDIGKTWHKIHSEYKKKPKKKRATRNPGD